MNYKKHFQTKETSQTEPIPGSNQIPNSAGGFAWAVDDWMRLDRFLVLGSEGGSYYASEHKLTVDNAQAVLRCIKENGVRVVNAIVAISEAGRAPKNDAALFVLAMAAGMGDDATRKAAHAAIAKVARTGTHLFTFLENVQAFRGWGRGLRRAIKSWYTSKEVSDLAYQVIKYQQRNGWTHRDALRLSHPKAKTPAYDALFRWITQGDIKDGIPALVVAYNELQNAKTVEDVLRSLNANPNLSWEMIPTQFLGEKRVWDALLPNLPMTAMLRNLARMTANGTIAPMSDSLDVIAKNLSNEERIRKARIHPISVLAAMTTYGQGHGSRGSLTWNPVPQVMDALDKAFYLSFGNIVPTKKRWTLALDVSGSMRGGEIAGIPGLTPRIGSAAMAMITARTESRHAILGFSHELVPIAISPRQRLDDIVHTIQAIPMGGTDCALPMLWALEEKIESDVFVIYTDSETWHGDIHPAQALNEYRRKMGIPAKLIVVGMVGNEFSIADPNDSGMMDVVGFDTATPEVMSQFVRN